MEDAETGASVSCAPRSVAVGHRDEVHERRSPTRARLTPDPDRDRGAHEHGRRARSATAAAARWPRRTATGPRARSPTPRRAQRPRPLGCPRDTAATTTTSAPRQARCCRSPPPAPRRSRRRGRHSRTAGSICRSAARGPRAYCRVHVTVAAGSGTLAAGSVRIAGGRRADARARPAAGDPDAAGVRVAMRSR